MINFNFTVDDADAENILAIMEGEANRCLGLTQQKYIIKVHNAETEEEKKQLTAEKDWYSKHGEYIKALIKKMSKSTTRV